MKHLYRRLSSSALGASNSWMSTSPYAPRSILQLKLPECNTPMTVRVAKAFTPFTNSQTLLVDATTPHDTLPDQFILKLADRRFCERPGVKPWSPEIEREFQLYMARHVTKHGKYPTVNADRGIAGNLPDDYPDDLDPPMWLSELWTWALGEMRLTIEANAYRHLVEPQHLGLVPRFYGEVEIPMSLENAPDHPAFQSVQGIILEYIPGVPMDSVRVGQDITLEEAEEVSQKLIALGRQIRRYGVMHNDLHFGNIVLRSPDRTPVIIDWGDADWTMADNPSLAERWNRPGMVEDFERGIRIYLKSQKVPWHRHETPYDDATWRQIARNNDGDERAWKLVNGWVRQDMTENEREAMYIEDTSVDEGRGLRWRIKPGVKTRKLRDPAPDK